MKRTISMGVILTFFLIIAIIPTSAKNITPDENNVFEDRFVAEYKLTSYDDYVYYEIYTEYNEFGEAEWVLVSATTLSGTDTYIHEVIGDWVFYDNFEWSPFSFKYCIYDVEDDTFIKLSQECLDKYEDLDSQMPLLLHANLIGDADGDKELSVMDATYIQRALAKICEFDASDDLSPYHFPYSENLHYISDFDRDGERTVLDATAIQMKLAKK